MAKQEEIEEDETPKKEGIMGLILGLVVVSLMAVGTGWFVGSTIGANNAKQAAEMKAEEKTSKEGGEEAEKPPMIQTEVLSPIVTNLMGSDNVWMRLELTVVMAENQKLGGELEKTKLVSELTAFLQTVKMQHISGPSGIIHLREDLVDRARIATQGRIENVLVTSMVVE